MKPNSSSKALKQATLIGQPAIQALHGASEEVRVSQMELFKGLGKVQGEYTCKTEPNLTFSQYQGDRVNSPKIVKDELNRMVSQGVQKISMLAWLWQGIRNTVSVWT